MFPSFMIAVALDELMFYQAYCTLMQCTCSLTQTELEPDKVQSASKRTDNYLLF